MSIRTKTRTHSFQAETVSTSGNRKLIKTTLETMCHAGYRNASICPTNAIAERIVIASTTREAPLLKHRLRPLLHQLHIPFAFLLPPAPPSSSAFLFFLRPLPFFPAFRSLSSAPPAAAMSANSAAPSFPYASKSTSRR